MGISIEFIDEYKVKSERLIDKLGPSISNKDMPFTNIRLEDVASVGKIADRFKGNFDTMLVVGIGGSSLGAKTVYHTIEKPERKLVFMDNVDPVYTIKKMKGIKWERTVFCFVSKSGKTLETIVHLNIVLSKLKAMNLNPSSRMVFIGNRGNDFDGLSKKLNMIFIEVPSDVGGRFSVFTPSGLFPLSFAGYDIEAFTRGALNVVKDKGKREKAILLGIHKYLSYTNGRNISVMMVYCDALKSFTEWYAQLWAESLGKDGKGQTPLKALGVRDQHSILQLFEDGPDDKVYQFVKAENYDGDLKLPDKTEIIDFIGSKRLSDVLSAEFHGTVKSLMERKRPIVKLMLKNLLPESMGELMMTYMVAVVSMAKLLNVNPYGQPAVERSKKIAYEMLKEG